MRYSIPAALAAFLSLALSSAPAFAGMPDIPVTFRPGRVEPASVAVPAGVQFRLHIRNQEARFEMFESYDLNRKIGVAPGKTVDIFIGPLQPGSYRFFGRNAPAATQGILVAQ